MAYRDPFTEQQGRYDPHYNETPAFDPYNGTEPHQAYDQGGYDSYAPGGYKDYSTTHQPADPQAAAYAQKEGGGYDSAGFARATTGSRSRDLRRWRYDHHGGSLWTKGTRGKCILRFCCCTIMIVLLLFISILLALLMWTRPPDVIVGTVGPPSTGSEIQLENNGVQINLAINITVNNPNYFSVSFPSIKANIYYPINNTYIGGGNQSSVTFPANTNKTITFPFSISYTSTMPSSNAILSDLETKCGINGGTASDITVDYDITLNVRVLFFTVSPTISNTASFVCPLSASDLSGVASSILGS